MKTYQIAVIVGNISMLYNIVKIPNQIVVILIVIDNEIVSNKL